MSEHGCGHCKFCLCKVWCRLKFDKRFVTLDKLCCRPMPAGNSSSGRRRRGTGSFGRQIRGRNQDRIRRANETAEQEEQRREQNRLRHTPESRTTFMMSSINRARVLEASTGVSDEGDEAEEDGDENEDEDKLEFLYQFVNHVDERLQESN